MPCLPFGIPFGRRRIGSCACRLYLASMAFESLTTAQLQTLHDDTLASLTRSLNATSYQIGTRQLSRAGIDTLSKLLADVSEELANRTDQSGGVGVVEFGAPQ